MDAPEPEACGSGQADGAQSEKRRKKLHTYEKARLRLQKIQQEKQKKHEEKEAAREARDKAKKEYMRMKKMKMKGTHYLKTKRGQPKLDAQVQFLLTKLEKQIEKEKRS